MGLRSFFSDLSRGEWALLGVLGLALVVFAFIGPGGAGAGLGAALATGLLASFLISLSRLRRERRDGKQVAAGEQSSKRKSGQSSEGKPRSPASARKRRKHGRR